MHRLSALALLAALPLSARAAEPEGAEFFEKRVRPVLVEYCYACHSGQAKEPKSGLRLDSRAALLKGGARGPAVVPGDVGKSRLLHAISYSNVDLSMPPRGKLPAQAIADLTAWVKRGAPWLGGDAAAAVEKKPAFDLQRRRAEHWAWQLVKSTPPPAVRDANWPLVPADRFILAKLEAAGLHSAPPADRATWLRRAYFDLVGLPPTPQEIDAFLNDVSPGAYATVVDRLLASPHFGERWGRHWLDLVRYSETKGHEFDAIIPNAYQYRDYVIRALNADVPYNQFVTEHIAGDLVPKPRLSGTDGFNESILGTGFWFLNEEIHSPVDIRADECDRIDNKIDVFSKTFLALTVSCARCHDHKFDAISQKDYYALSGFLLSSAYRQVRFDSMEQNKRIAKELEELREKYRKLVWEALAETIRPVAGQLAERLLAARTAIRAGKAGDTTDVRAWVKYLATVATDANDPFYAWAMLARLKDDEAEEKLAAIVGEYRRQIRKPTRTILEREFEFGTDSQLAEAYVTDEPFCWGTPDQPIRRIRRFSELEFDPFFARLSVARGTESDHGVLGAKPRRQILRTEKLMLDQGRVFIFARGQGRVYAAVDSHTLIAGPLHGRLIQDFDTAGKWKWIGFDLTAYKGHRCHLEFSPRDDRELSIDLENIVEADAPPQLKPDAIPWQLIKLDSLEDLAAMYQAMLQVVADTRIGDVSTQQDFARSLAMCVVSHPELFGIKDFTKVREAAAPFFKAQNDLTKQFRSESRLAPGMCDVGPVNERVLIRGSHKSPGEETPRRFLEALAGASGIRPAKPVVSDADILARAFVEALAGPDGIKPHGSLRLELAQQIADSKLDPLIARVIVNRVWHHLFGRGIVASVDNFGVMGDRPTHPELLDYLAYRFVREGWSLKKLIRELALSQMYRMASRGDAEPADPENKLLHAMRLKRLEGEVIRDSMLALAARLDAKMFGAPVPIYLGNIPEGRGKPTVDGPLDGAGRRSVYVAVRRNFLSPFMLAFDTPAPFSTMGRRTVSNVPAQALILMNDPFVHQQAERWGRRVAAEPGDVAAKVGRMYQSAFARRPNTEELARSREFIERRGGDARAWGDLAHVLFNVKEFIYVP